MVFSVLRSQFDLHSVDIPTSFCANLLCNIVTYTLVLTEELGKSQTHRGDFRIFVCCLIYECNLRELVCENEGSLPIFIYIRTWTQVSNIPTSEGAGFLVAVVYQLFSVKPLKITCLRMPKKCWSIFYANLGSLPMENIQFCWWKPIALYRTSFRQVMSFLATQTTDTRISGGRITWMLNFNYNVAQYAKIASYEINHVLGSK